MASAIPGGGNTRYFPPEYFHDQTSTLVTKKGDIYTMGMTIYEVNPNNICAPRLLSFSQVLTDKKPFHNYTPLLIGKAIIVGKRPEKLKFNITRGYTDEVD